MSSQRKRAATREKVSAYRARLRAQGLRPVQLWLPDVRSPDFAAQAHREALGIANSPEEADEQAFIDAISAPLDEWSAAKSGPWRAVPTAPVNRGPWLSSRMIVSMSLESITVCGLATTGPEAPMARLEVMPSASNGLRERTRLMVDKITVPRKRLGRRIGTLDNEDVTRLNRAIAIFLGLAGA